MKTQLAGMLLALLLGLGIGYVVGAWQEDPFDRCVRVRTEALKRIRQLEALPFPAGDRLSLSDRTATLTACMPTGGP